MFNPRLASYLKDFAFAVWVSSPVESLAAIREAISLFPKSEADTVSSLDPPGTRKLFELLLISAARLLDVENVPDAIVQIREAARMLVHGVDGAIFPVYSEHFET